MKEEVWIGLAEVLLGAGLFMYADTLAQRYVRWFGGSVFRFGGEDAVRRYAGAIRWISRAGAIAVALLGVRAIIVWSVSLCR